MILCICRRLNERSVAEAIRAGASSPKAVQAYHGCQFNCGKCKPAIAEAIARERALPVSQVMAAE